MNRHEQAFLHIVWALFPFRRPGERRADWREVGNLAGGGQSGGRWAGPGEMRHNRARGVIQCFSCIFLTGIV